MAVSGVWRPRPVSTSAGKALHHHHHTYERLQHRQPHHGAVQVRCLCQWPRIQRKLGRGPGRWVGITAPLPHNIRNCSVSHLATLSPPTTLNPLIFFLCRVWRTSYSSFRGDPLPTVSQQLSKQCGLFLGDQCKSQSPCLVEFHRPGH